MVRADVTKILIIADHRPNRSPSQRFRFEQYLNSFQQRGYHYKFSYLLSEHDDRIFYTQSNYFRKAFILFKLFLKRLIDLPRAFNFDILFIQREAFITGSVFFESTWKLMGKKIIFDFDDSIWLLDVSDVNKKFGWLKNPGKISKIIQLSDQVIAGNKYLSSFAKKFNTAVTIIPTTINTEEYFPATNKNSSEKLCIGWSGSITTIKHFDQIIPVLHKLKLKYADKIVFKVIGDGNYKNEALGIIGKSWNKTQELDELRSIDIGIMPLPDDDWSKGKCGLKGLQYMALSIPAIMSPVGVNTEIIQDGVNGFLALTDEEWIEKLSLLIESPELRKKLGDAGRKTVVENYSVEANKDKYIQVFEKILSS